MPCVGINWPVSLLTVQSCKKPFSITVHGNDKLLMAEGKPAAQKLSILLPPWPTPLADLPISPQGQRPRQRARCGGGITPTPQTPVSQPQRITSPGSILETPGNEKANPQPSSDRLRESLGWAPGHQPCKSSPGDSKLGGGVENSFTSSGKASPGHSLIFPWQPRHGSRMLTRTPCPAPRRSQADVCLSVCW